MAEYIGRHSLEAARKWVLSLFRVAERLESFPESGRFVPEMGERRGLREVVHGEYRIIYRAEPEQVLILTVRHSRRAFDPGEVEDEK
ncbi:MAG: type II toxin-antitoxin system RelE/ParE family toxin [Rubrobacter sp.]|nr:type II toxin-antitoxin system RelE/ParE family toxin [Rubrobacter sp.]